MSVARGFGLNGKSIYSNVTKLMQCNLNFIVDSANGNGLGVRSIKSNGYIENVFMHTSQTPGVGGNSLTNPNPAVGFALIQMKQNFNKFLGMNAGFVTPTATSTKIDNGATLTVGQVYIITTLGNATGAQWTTVGVPAGVTPAVGVSFVAIATGAGSANTSTSRVMLPTTSGIDLIEVIGDTNTQTTGNIASNSGQWITVQFSKQLVTMASYTPAGTNSAPALTMASYTPAGTNDSSSPPIFTGTPHTLTGTVAAPVFTGTPATLTGTITSSPAAPADNSVCGVQLWFDGSSVTIDGL